MQKLGYWINFRTTNIYIEKCKVDLRISRCIKRSLHVRMGAHNDAHVVQKKVLNNERDKHFVFDNKDAKACERVSNHQDNPSGTAA